MHRIDTPGATAGNLFQNGNPFASVPATVVGAKWLNAVQEELATFIEAQSITLDDQDATQLAAALTVFVAAQVKVLAGHELDIVAPSALTAGDGLLLEDTFGVVKADAAAAAPAVLFVLGTHNLPKLSTDVMSQGQRLYWDDGNSRLTITATGNRLVGIATADRASGTTTVDCRLNGWQGPTQ